MLTIHRHDFRVHQGCLIFVMQVLLVILVPLLDDGGRMTPIPFAAAVLAEATLTVLFLGYRRLAAGIAVAGIAALAWSLADAPGSVEFRFPLWIVLTTAGIASALLCIRTAFALHVPPVQRILCGAASFVMLGFVFAGIHGVIGIGLGVGYALAGGVEAQRQLRWVDFLWLSFSTLTTAGFGDVSPVGPGPCAVATLEGLCGILFPATLIARIATLPDVAVPRAHAGSSIAASAASSQVAGSGTM
jgi:hypothetical protein